MKKKIIAHVAGGLTTGGVEAVIYNYFSHMPLEEYELHYLTYTDPNEVEKKRFEDLGFIVHTLPRKKEHFWKAFWAVYRIFKENKVNIVHSHMTLMSFLTSFIGILTGVKVRIAHSHLAQYPTGIKKYIYALFKIFSRVTSTDWFACGVEAANYLYGEKNVKAGRVTILNNAIDLTRFTVEKEVRERIRQKYGLQDSYCVGHVGRYTEQKNHMFLIDIFEEIAGAREDAKLLLVGEGPLMEQVREKIASKNLQDRVIIAGSCTNMQEMYQAMDVMVFPSLYEGLSVALLEAQAVGLNIFVSDTVTPELNLTEGIHYLSLKDSPKKWCEAVLEKAGSYVAYDNKQVLAEKNYDIYREAKKLDDFYNAKIAGKQEVK
ncbi:MAG: glycosyltransferase family 1 protein [Lachnospiraceae bacterium]|nr:glycosyltransferase family 1 protein [Lachnospiraceae bacterium]